jgi:DHA1 family bicyclomycin/chloramphenicol resistance-like MFS transporter
VQIKPREFIFLVAAMMACQALAVDAMLPAFPVIGHAFGVPGENRLQLIVTAYITGLGLGQLAWGPISDRYGRRRVLLVGLAAYAVAALLGGFSHSFRELLAWRFVHGAAAASVIVSRSMIRDLYDGRQMARVMSLTFIVFLMVPMIAPGFGQMLLWAGPWQLLFVAFALFAAVVWAWVLRRLPETLHPEYRMTLTVGHLVAATRTVVLERASLWYTLAITFIFGSIMAYVGMVQSIFQDYFHRAALMPGIFALCAAGMAVASFSNSRIVGRFGMRRTSHAGLLAFIALTAIHSLLARAGLESLPSFVLLQATTLACVGFLGANFGAMAMESMGEVAGVAASLQGSISTIGGALIGAFIGHWFNGTTLPLALGALGCGLGAFGCVLLAEGGRLFRAHHSGEMELAPPAH